MSRMKKTLKKYERPILLAIVVILLATFSVAGAVRCGSDAADRSIHMGGSFNVTPSEREDVSDTDFDVARAHTRQFQSAVRFPSINFRNQLAARGPVKLNEEAWTALVTAAAAREAGYRAGPHQIDVGVKDMVGILLRGGALGFTDVGYQNFLRNAYRGPQDVFEASVEEVILRDQFLYPLITSSRYSTTYAEAFEEWKHGHERVDLEYVSVSGAPFAQEVLRREETRAEIGRQQRVLSDVAKAAGQVFRVRAMLEAAKKKDGEYPASAGAVGAKPDVWGTELRLKVEGDDIALASAGPDKTFDTADDVTLAVRKQLDTRAALLEVGTQLMAKHNATEAWPATLEDLKQAAGDDALPAATRIAQDGWDQDLVYTPGTDGQAVRLHSKGPDGQDGSADDIAAAFDENAVRVPLGAGLAVYGAPDAKDGWGRAFRLSLLRAPATWTVASAGADGAFGSDDDLRTSNERELTAFFEKNKNDYRLPLRHRFETLLVHLPLVSDAVLRSLWEQFPEYHPTSEEELYRYWRTFKGPDFHYSAEDPADAEAGHGAELSTKVLQGSDTPEAKPTLVPARDIFPDPLVDPKAPKKDDAGGDDAGADDAGGDDAGAEDDAVGAADKENRKIFREKGWREIVIRETFMESLLNGLLKKVRDNRIAIQKKQPDQLIYERAMVKWKVAQAAWAKANADKPEADRKSPPAEPIKVNVPAEITFETLLKSELSAAVAAALPGPSPFRHWAAPRLLSRKEWMAREDFTDGLKVALDGLKEDGQYYGIPVQLNGRLTKVLVRRHEMKGEEQQDLEDVREDVFARFAEWRQMDTAADELKKLRQAAVEAMDALGSGATDAARQAAWEQALAAWSKDLVGGYRLESTGLYLGRRSPAPVEVTAEMSPAEAGEAERRNFIWRAGYGSVEKSADSKDAVQPESGTFGRTILRDAIVKDRDPEIVDGKPQPKDKGTGSVFLVRVKERQFPSRHEFSPRQYLDWLHTDVFGDILTRRVRMPLQKMSGRMNQAVANWFANYPWMQEKFKIETNNPLDADKRESDADDQ